MTLLKEKIYNSCHELLNKKIAELHSALRIIDESINNETKSTAGDKHETGRAMMQLEQEKLGRQLKELEDQKTELQKTRIDNSLPAINKGALVKTDKGFIFIAVGLGKIIVQEKTIIAISASSPLAKKLIGLKVNDSADVNGVNYLILEII